MENVEDIYALAPIQQGLLYHCIKDPGTGLFVSQVAGTLNGALDAGAFRRAWELLLARHPALRSCFLWDGVDEPLQVVRDKVDLPWAEADWRGKDAARCAADLAGAMHAERRAGFDLAAAPLLAMHLVRTGETRWRWWCTFHHLVSDGWSTAILLKEMHEVYAALRSGVEPALPPPFRYRDYIAWHAGQDMAAAESFWRRELDGVRTPSRLNLPAAAAPDAPGRHHYHRLDLGRDESRALTALAADARVTLNTVMQAAWGLLLAKYAHDDDVMFGVTLSGRPADLAGVEQGVGLFINTLPLRLRIPPETPLSEWLTALQRRHFGLIEQQFTPLAAVQRWSGLASGEALFDTILVFENYPSAAPDADTGLQLSDLTINEHSNYPLALLVVPGDALRFIAVYDDTRFSEPQVAHLLAQLKQLLTGFARQPQRPVGSFALTADIAPLSAPGAADDPAPALNVVTLIERSMAAQPEAIAVQSRGGGLSYRELDLRSAAVAAGLRERGVGVDDRVGIYADRSADTLVALVGVLRAGAAYVPLDRRYPVSQIEYVAEDAGLAAVLAPERLRAALPALAAPCLALESFDGAAPSRLAAAPGENDPAYVIYTSGSTGRPKGVIITHRALAASTRARLEYYGGRAERYLLLSSFAFDSSVAGIYWTLCSGGTLVLPEDGLEQDMAGLGALIAEAGVTHLLCLPSLYEVLLESSGADRLASLRVVIVAGEACPAPLVAQHYHALPGSALYNEYGPTEATVWSTVQRLAPVDAGGPVPIGQPVPGVRLWLVDQHGQPVPPGVYGELHVGGAQLARGYLNNAALTGQRFVSLPALAALPDADPVYRTGDLACARDDGSLLFGGRADDQLKIRGFRVEPGGIEQVIAQHPEAGDAAVKLIGRSGSSGRARLVAFVVAAGSEGGLEARLRAHLERSLPDYMWPDRLMFVDQLPRLPNGKVDYRALPDLAAPERDDDSGGAAPRSDAERALAGVWAGLLGLERVGVDDRFLALGGDSILSIQMISRARQAGLAVEPRHLLRDPTLAELAAMAASAAAPPAPAGEATGEAPLTPIQHWFFDQQLAVPGHWNQSALFELPSGVDAGLLAGALRCCWQHHHGLRARFVTGPRRERRQVIADAAAGELPMQVIDIAGLAEAECAKVMDEAMAAAQAGFDPARGNLARAVLFSRGESGPARLLLAVHHLVIDAVSWRILSEDIESAYLALREQRTPQLTEAVTPLALWAGRLAEWAGSAAARAELAFWQRPFDIAGSAFPADTGAAGNGTEASARHLEATLDSARSAALLAGANEAYQTRADELMITALALAYAQQTGHKALRIELESHGRSPLIDELDVSRTIGWFTAQYPALLQLTACDGPAAAIKSIKEQLRGVPRHGIGYGALRYLGDAAGAAALDSRPAPSLLFNYLGRASPAPPGGLLRPVPGAEASSRDPRCQRLHRLEINAAIANGQLGMRFSYSTDCHAPATVEQLAAATIAELTRLIDHCEKPTSAGYTPSDFPEVDLSQDELDRLLDELD